MEPSSVGVLMTYCVLILAASLAGGWVPLLVRLTHRRMELLVSFVSGVMLGVAVLHLLPDALQQRAMVLHGADPHDIDGVFTPVVAWLLAGFLAMFFVERFFCFHHHDVPDAGSDAETGRNGGHPPHRHTLTWAGAAVGLTVHSLVAGVALAASVQAAEGASLARAAGLGTFLAIFLHKPFDSMTLGAVMAVGRRPALARHLVNGAFALVVPIGALIFVAGEGRATIGQGGLVSGALAFSAGTFLCISLSDLLPELQFHRHDRIKLSAALLLGLAVAWGAKGLEELGGAGDLAGARSTVPPVVAILGPLNHD